MCSQCYNELQISSQACANTPPSSSLYQSLLAHQDAPVARPQKASETLPGSAGGPKEQSVSQCLLLELWSDSQGKDCVTSA